MNVSKKYSHQMPDFSFKCTKFNFDWSSAPDPAGGAHSAPPDPLAGFGEGEGRRGRKEGKGK